VAWMRRSGSEAADLVGTNARGPGPPSAVASAPLLRRRRTREHAERGDEEVANRVVCLIGAPAARELLDVLTRSEEERAALIGRLSLRADGVTVAELLIDLEEDEIARLHFMEAFVGSIPLRTPNSLRSCGGVAGR
jgi:hypothetical protein